MFTAWFTAIHDEELFKMEENLLKAYPDDALYYSLPRQV
jgi:hypothetical protein